jgi:hypothetical protein
MRRLTYYYAEIFIDTCYAIVLFAYVIGLHHYLVEVDAVV